MRITLLGTAAGGGFPQWNCACRLCSGVRSGTLRAQPRSQSSIFVQPGDGGPGQPGLLVNASPDILAQVKAQPVLWPAPAAGARRHSPIAAVLLCDGQVDHVTGLAMLRERGAPLPLWCTTPVAEDLRHGYPLLDVLGHYCGVELNLLAFDEPAFELPGLPGLRLRALALSSKAAPYSPHRDAPVAGDNIGLVFTDSASRRSAFYAPGLGEVSDTVFAAMSQADAVLVDGTFWTDDEMIALGLSKKTARDIGHLPQHGAGGMLEWLDRLRADTRRVLVHINNTNPILDEDSPERAELARHRVEVGADGMAIQL